MDEEKVGVVTHYFSHLQVAGILLEKPLRVGDTIHIRGHTSDFTQTVTSMQLEHETITEAEPGQDIAIKVIDHAREHDEVFRVTDA